MFLGYKQNNKWIKNRIIRDIRNLIEHEEVITLWSNNYTEYKTKGDRIKTLWVEKYLNKISWNL